jgi:hypothetical protein
MIQTRLSTGILYPNMTIKWRLRNSGSNAHGFVDLFFWHANKLFLKFDETRLSHLISIVTVTYFSFLNF